MKCIYMWCSLGEVHMWCSPWVEYSLWVKYIYIYMWCSLSVEYIYIHVVFSMGEVYICGVLYG